MKHSSFRGRPLLGCEIKVPEGYSGYVLKKQPRDLRSKTDLFNVEQSFDKITYWNLDKIPSHNDAFASALDWFDISAAVSTFFLNLLALLCHYYMIHSFQLHSKELPLNNINGTNSS